MTLITGSSLPAFPRQRERCDLGDRWIVGLVHQTGPGKFHALNAASHGGLQSVPDPFLRCRGRTSRDSLMRGRMGLCVDGNGPVTVVSALMVHNGWFRGIQTLQECTGLGARGIRLLLPFLLPSLEPLSPVSVVPIPPASRYRERASTTSNSIYNSISTFKRLLESILNVLRLLLT